MKISEVISFLETMANLSLQEHYDNSGLLTGNRDWECTGIICSLDTIEEVVLEATEKKCNLIVAHHPIIFGGLKKINGKNYVERTVIRAIKNDIAIYAIHTNLDNVIRGVNGRIADMLGLKNVTVLLPREDTLRKLFTFVPINKAEQVRNAIFAAGGGFIGNYSECSFNTEGEGTFRAESGTHPYVGEIGHRHTEKEIKLEVILPSFLEGRVIAAMKAAHPYEEIAYDVVRLTNANNNIGSGVIGDLEKAEKEEEFLSRIKKVFNLKLIRHSTFTGRPVKRIAVCGGAGSFLVSKALAAGADIYITADMKYHEFFDADGQLLIADIGHYESEQFTINLLQEVLEKKFLTFAVLKTSVETNPVKYFL